MVTYLRFRKSLEYNGMSDVRPYKTALQPYATWSVLLLITILTLTNGFYGIIIHSLFDEVQADFPAVFFPSEWNVADFLAAYITIPIFLALYFSHKAYFATHQMITSKSWNDLGQVGSSIKHWCGAWSLG